MNTLEITPQKQKQFDSRKQDHGDAAEQRGHFKADDSFFEKKYDRRGNLKKDAEIKIAALEDMSYQELEAEANKILLENEEKDEADAEDSTEYQDFFPSEAEYGVDSKHEVRVKLAKQATLDTFGDDEVADSTFANPIRIRNRL